MLESSNVLPIMCAMNDDKEADLGIFFGKDDANRMYFCSEECRQRYGLIGVSRIAMAEVETRKPRKPRRARKRVK